MTKTVQELAPKILEEIKAAKSILVHCHPGPDPDSVCSALATKLALESIGKKVTVIKGDSNIPSAFSHFPGFEAILEKNFFEINIADFDLFLIQDTASIDRVSQLAPVVFPPTLKTIVIDHHISNPKFAMINLVDATYTSTCQILADLFKEWKINLTHDLALNLIIGTYTDTGGFKYSSTTSEVLQTVADLSKIAPDYPKTIATMEHSNTPDFLRYQGLALSKIENLLDGHLALVAVSYDDLVKNNISPEHASPRVVSHLLISVVGWDVGVCLVEKEPGQIKISFRTRDEQKYDLSVITGRIGGGGHKAAAGASISGTLQDAKKAVIEAVRQSM